MAKKRDPPKMILCHLFDLFDKFDRLQSRLLLIALNEHKYFGDDTNCLGERSRKIHTHDYTELL